MTDTELLVQLQNSSGATYERAFGQLVHLYGNRLYQHLQGMLGNTTDAEDVLQDVLVKVYRNVGNFQRKSQLYTWLYRIATNEALTFLDKRKRKLGIIRPTDTIPDHRREGSAAQDGPDEATIKRKLQEAIDRLPTKQKQVFCLRYFDEKNYQEIAAITGTSMGGLKASYHHAVRKIEAYLKAEN